MTESSLAVPTTGPRRGLRVPRRIVGPYLLAAPLALVFLAFVVLPVCLLGVIAMSGQNGAITSENLLRFFSDGLSLPILGRTLMLGLESALVALLLGYPLALVFCASGPRVQGVLVFLIVLPLLTSAVVRTFAWVVILGRQGLVNTSLLSLGLTGRPLSLLYTETWLTLAMAQIELPLMTLPLISVLSNVDPRLGEASRSLGAGPWATLFRVFLPLSLPGALAGLQLVFAAACGALITQSIVGGGRLIYAPLYIYQQGIQAQNWPFAATISLMLLASVLGVVAMFNALSRLASAHAHV